MGEVKERSTTRKARPLHPMIESALQRVVLAASNYSKHELANHAAAGAYSFLLSAMPAILLIAVALGPFLPDTAAALGRIVSYIKGFASADAIEGAARALVGRETGFFAGAFALINLIWTARAFVVSLQRGLRVLSGASTGGAIRQNAFSLALEIGALVLVMAIMALSELVLAFAEFIGDWGALNPLVSLGTRALLNGVPLLCIYAFVYASFRSGGIRAHTAAHAFGCVAGYWLFQYASKSLVNAARYDVLYGVLGGIVLLLINVFVFFSLFFFAASLAKVNERFDVLLLARFHARTSSSGRDRDWVSKALFSAPTALFRKYAKAYPAGAQIFRRDDLEKTVYYLYSGKVEVDIRSGAGSKRVKVRRGEFFGEMSLILDEARMGDAIAATECTVLAIPPTVFRRFIDSDQAAMRKLLDTLTARLKHAHGENG